MTISIYQQYKAKGLIKKNELSVYEKSSNKDKSEKEKELDRIVNEIHKAQGMIQRVIPQLDSACSKYVQMLNDLLEKKKQKEQQPKHYQEAKEVKPKKSKKQNLRKMYNKIAAMCHPDKTDDPENHEKFLAAKKAIDNDDEYAIFEIYREFDDEVSIEDLINLDQQILEKAIELQQLQGTNSYKISFIFESGRQKDAKKIYLQGIMEQIQKLEAEEW